MQSDQQEIKHNEKILTIKKGQELSIFVSDDMRSPTAFMHTAYRQAVCAVSGITEQSRRFNEALSQSADLFDSLFQYSGNIIAFAGQRGCGKTSTMLSFAKFLADGQYDPPRSYPCIPHREAESDSHFQNHVERLKKLRFLSLSPIAPSILGEKQSILTVVLSRLYSYMSDQFQTKPYISPDLKQEVTLSFQACLSGIRGAKQGQAIEQEDFAMLQDVSDGMALRVSFYRLIINILKALQNEHNTWQDTYIVLQLDDTDSQMRVGYEVLEDIRKYLMLPNVIILTSADFDMLRRVVEQHYRLELSELIRDNREELGRDLSKAASKYIDKLIPPSNLIFLPKLSSMLMRWGSQMKMRYGSEEELQNGKVLTSSLQSDLLNRIYKKTEIIFVPPQSGPHEIIPTTLRGINQLLSLLGEMKEIPRFIPDDGTLSRKVSTEAFFDNLVKYIETEYLPIAEANLQLFADYFTQEWVNARIREPEDREFLKRMERSTTAKVQVALDYLHNKYENNKRREVNDSSGSNSENVKQGTYSNDIEKLLKYTDNLYEKICQRGDLSLLFAVKTIITLENHMWILQQKRASLYAMDTTLNKTTAFRPLYFSKHSNSYLPVEYRIYSNAWKTDAGEVAIKFKTKRKEFGKVAASQERYDLLSNALIVKKSRSRYYFNLLNIPTFYLRLSELKQPFAILGNDNSDIQRCIAIYNAQETALRIASNWDVWDLLAKDTPEFETDTNTPKEDYLFTFFKATDTFLNKKIGIDIFTEELGLSASWANLVIAKTANIIDASIVWSFIVANRNGGNSPSPTPAENQRALDAIAGTLSSE